MELNDVPENIFNISADDLTLANLEKINIFYESIDNQSDIHANIDSTECSELSNKDAYDENVQSINALLKGWNLECILQVCLDECIDIDALKYIKPRHIDKLLSTQPLGILIKFENCVETWQKSLQDKSLIVIDNSLVSGVQNLQTSLQNKPLSEIDRTLVSGVQVHTILANSTRGKLLLDYYKIHKELNDSIRGNLVDLIVHDIISKNIPMSISLAESVAEQIAIMFPSEIKDIYFMRHGNNKAPRGKLYAKFYNCMRALKTSGLKTNPVKTNNSAHNDTFTKRNDSFVVETDVGYLLDIIKYDDEISFPNLLIHWTATMQYRLNKIKEANSTAEILKEWKHYSMPLGYKLVDIDFNGLYQSSTIPDLCIEFQKSYDNILLIVEQYIKDRDGKLLLQELKTTNDLTQNGKDCTLFHLLSSLFVPTSRKVTKDDKGKNSVTKYSIKDSQKSFIIFNNSISESENYIEHLKNKKLPIQPFIIVIGTPLKPNQILVYFDSIKYKVFNITRAIDICFKLFNLFNLQYPLQSCAVWMFIQKFYYSISTKYDTPHQLVTQVLHSLKKQK